MRVFIELHYQVSFFSEIVFGWYIIPQVTALRKSLVHLYASMGRTGCWPLVFEHLFFAPSQILALFYGVSLESVEVFCIAFTCSDRCLFAQGVSETDCRT